MINTTPKGYRIIIKDARGKLVTPIGAPLYRTLAEARADAAALRDFRASIGADDLHSKYVIIPIP